MKHIKLFEQFKVNEADVEAIAPRKLRVTKDFKDKVKTMVALSDQYKKMEAELKKIGTSLGLYEGEVQKTLEEYGAQFVKIDDVMIELKKKEGRVTKSYEKIATALQDLLPKTEAVVAQVETIYDKFTKHNPDKTEMEYKQVKEGEMSEGFKEVVAQLGSWIKTGFKKLISALNPFKKGVSELEKAVKAA